MSTPFTVIVPIYKVEPYLHRCIDSILAQTFPDFELLLIDDGSPDRCPEICDGYAAADPRVRVIHKKNGGLVSARNTGIREAMGDFICYVDGDDWIYPDLLDTVFREAILTHSPDMVIFELTKVFSDHHEEIRMELPEGLYQKQELQKHVYPYMMYDSRKPFCKGLIFPAACNKIYRRKLLLEHYCTSEQIRMGEDNAFVFECIWHSDSIYFCNQVLYYYNQQNNTSMVHSYDATRFDNNQLLTAYLEQHLGGINPELDEQINAFKAYWLIMAVFHEVKHHRKLGISARHLRENIRKTQVLRGIHLHGLPLMAKAFLILLTLKLYRVTLLASKVVNHLRDQN